jgi:LysR family transcriptional regulator, nod-box dependent transcriptional activator
MRFQGLDLNLLVALNTLLQDRNVTQAADRLHIGQPGMSAALNRLREYFNDDLLVPTGRRMVLTPLAEQLATPLQEVLDDIERRILSQGEFDPATAQQKFVLALSDYLMSVLLPSLLLVIENQAPGLRFEVRALSDRNDLDIEKCETDFLIIPSEFTSPHHPTALLHTESWACICWAGNTRVGERISEEEYFALGHVLTQFGRGQGYTHEERFLRERGMTRRADVVVPGLNLIPELIVGTNRIATVPSRLARKAARKLPLRILELPVEIPTHQTMLQWNRIKNADLATIWVKDRLIEVYSAEAVGREKDADATEDSRATEPS